MPHPLTEWLPNDAPWATLPTAVLKKQCAVRNLPTTGHPNNLVQRLSAYSQAKVNTSDTKRLHPWLTEPVSRVAYKDAEIHARCLKLQVVRVVDNPGRRRDSLRRDFEICDRRLWYNHAWEKRKPVIVCMDTVLQCNCPKNGLCEHNIFILRFVLNCPDPYLWQRALLPSELQTIYQHSHASRALSPENSETCDDFCIFCFQDAGTGSEALDHCKGCTRVMHYICRLDAERVRMPVRGGMCWICYEDIKWDIEKFCWNNRVLPAAPRITPAVPARTDSAAEATGRELIQRKVPEDDVSKTSSSSSNKDSKERQLSNTQSTNRRFPAILSSLPPSSSTSPALKSTFNQVVPYSVDRLRQGHRKSTIITLKLSKKGAALSTSSPNNESTPLPGNPALIWQETQKTREQQQQDKERRQAALPNLSPELGHALPTLNPGRGDMEPSEVATAPNSARIRAGDPTSAGASSSAVQLLASPAVTTTAQHNQPGATSIPAHNPSIVGGMSQAPQVSVTTASATESAGATGAQRTISDINTDNSASASAPVPTDHSTSAPTHAHAGMQTTIDRVKAMELVQECSRLAKRSLEIRKNSEREAKRMEKRHRLELKKITKMEKERQRREMKKILKMEKKHRRELKKTKRKSNQEIKRLEKKIERLEKEVLKALARPKVAEGAAA